MPGTPTKAQYSALKWLRNRNGDGMFDKHGVLLAAGETSPVTRSTWNHLITLKWAELYAGGRRLRVTDFGSRINVSHVEESR